MEEHIVKIKDTRQLTHDVIQLTVEKPEGYTFIPGQATEASINNAQWKDEARPFTFTGLNNWPDLQFTIKIYDDHDGVTHQLGKLKKGDELIIRDVWGAIEYKGSGVFLAAGAGVTPFIAIFRDLADKGSLTGCKLYFSNKTDKDIILEEEFSTLLKDDFHSILTRDEKSNALHGRIDADFIAKHIKDFDQHFYVCGPEGFNDDVLAALQQKGAKADSLVFEK